MKTNHIYTLLTGFKRREFKEIIDLGKLPSSSLKLEDIRLLKYLIRIIEQEKPSSHSDTKKILKTLYKNSSTIEQNWFYITKRLANFIHRYILYSRSDIESYTDREVIYNFYLENSFSSLVTSGVQKSKQSMLDNPRRAYNYQLKLFILNQQAAIHEKESGNTSNLLSSCVWHLEYFYIENRLRLICEFINQSNEKDEDYRLRAEESYIIQKAEKITDDPAIILYFLTYQLLSSNKEDYNLFNQIELLVKKIGGSFIPLYKKPFFEYLLNNCIYNVKRGKIKYAEKYIDVIIELEDLGLLLEGKYILLQRFKNSVTAALLSEKLTWLEQFINTYSNRIKEDYLASAKALALARYAFVKKDDENFDKIEEQLNRIQFNNISEKIESEKLLLKIWYQSDNTQLFNNKAMAFRRYINRHKKNKTIPNKKAQQILNFISIILSLKKGKGKKHPLNREDFHPKDFLWMETIIERE